MASSLSISKILKAVTEARTASPAPHLCVVGSGDDLARVVGVLSAGAKDEAGGVSALVDALTPADFPIDPHLAGRWDIVVLVAAGSACCAGRSRRARRPPRRLHHHRARRDPGRGRLGARVRPLRRRGRPRSRPRPGRQAHAREPPHRRRRRRRSRPRRVAAVGAPHVLRPCRAHQRRAERRHRRGGHHPRRGHAGDDRQPDPHGPQDRPRVRGGARSRPRSRDPLDRGYRVHPPHAGAPGARLRAGIRLGRQGRRRVLGHDRARPGRHRVLRGRGAAPCLADAKDQSTT